eukprot:gb/GECG01016733.1/.p1 GENE.gb/GECG01016733.1/~~gb/GECG01016733.1/.p1  ORF type:complete len:916 (+),score=115.98 gb/GECG01016733.1/:1-2748(+)
MGSTQSKGHDTAYVDYNELRPYVQQLLRLFPSKYNVPKGSDPFENTKLVKDAKKLMAQESQSQGQIRAIASDRGVKRTAMDDSQYAANWNGVAGQKQTVPGTAEAAAASGGGQSKLAQQQSSRSTSQRRNNNIRATTGQKCSWKSCFTCGGTGPVSGGKQTSTQQEGLEHKSSSFKLMQGEKLTETDVDTLAEYYRKKRRPPPPPAADALDETKDAEGPDETAKAQSTQNTSDEARSVPVREQQTLKENESKEQVTIHLTKADIAQVVVASSTKPVKARPWLSEDEVTVPPSTASTPLKREEAVVHGFVVTSPEAFEDAERTGTQRSSAENQGENPLEYETIPPMNARPPRRKSSKPPLQDFGPEHDHHPANVDLNDARFWVLDHSKRIGSVQDKYYIARKPLGRGHYGTVYPGHNKETGEGVAVKCIPKLDPKNLEMLKSEISILENAYHPNIIRLLDVYEDVQNIYVVTELCTGGELFDRIQAKGHYKEHTAAVRFREMLIAIEYLHKQSIVHRDLKPENFLMDSPDEDACLKMIDFGLAVTLSRGQTLSSRVGTPYYIAPEVLHKRYDHMCDLWSLGVILYVLLCGYPPFWGEKDIDIFKRILRGEYSFSGPEWLFVSEDPRDLITKLLKGDPSERIKLPNALVHRWVLHEGMTDTIALPEHFYQALKAFCGVTNMKRISVYWIAVHMSTKLLTSFRELFDSLRQGYEEALSLEDLNKIFVTVGMRLGDQEMRFIRRRLAQCGITSIGVREFTAIYMRKPVYLSHSILTKLQDWWDHNDSGAVELNDFVTAISRVCHVPLELQYGVVSGSDEIKKALQRPNTSISIPLDRAPCVLSDDSDGYIAVPEGWHRQYTALNVDDLKKIMEKRVPHDQCARAVELYKLAARSLLEADLDSRGYIGLKTFFRVMGARG